MINWILAITTLVIWVGATCWYFKNELKAMYANRKNRAAERRAAKKG